MDSEESMDIKIKQELHEEVPCEDNEGALMDASVSNGSVKLEDEVKKELREEFANEIDDNTENLCELCKSYFPNLSSLQDHMQNNDNCDEKIDAKGSMAKGPKNSVNFDTVQNTEVKVASVEGIYTEEVEIEQEEKCNEKKTKKERQRSEKKDDRFDSEINEYENDKRELVNLIMKEHIILSKKHDDGIFDMTTFNARCTLSDESTRARVSSPRQVSPRLGRSRSRVGFLCTSQRVSRDMPRALHESSALHLRREVSPRVYSRHKIVKKEKTEGISENDTDELVNLVMKDHIILKTSICMKIQASEETSQNSMFGKSNIHANKLDGHNQVNNELCETTYDTIINVISDTHNESNSRKRGVSCDVCKKTFSRRGQLARHVKRFHLMTNETQNTPSPNHKHVCTICDKSYETRKSVRRHIRNSHTSPVFCDVCSKKFSCKEGLARHVKRFHWKTNETENTPSPNQKHVCTPCDKSYESGEKLKIHIRNSHKSYVFCDVCSQKFRRKYNLERHMKVVHLRIEETENHVCTFCDKSYENREKLKIHFYNTHKNPVFCDVCSKKFTRKANLERHMKVVHLRIKETENHVCTFCDKSYENREKLKIHFYNTHKNPVFCDVCSKKFMRKAYLERHMKVVHLRIKETENHVCTFCDKSYENRKKFKIHFYNTHKNPVFCDFCSKKYSRKAILEKHMMAVHLRKDVYKCKFCEKKYFDETSLNRHTRIYCTKKKPITCKLCRKKYANQKNFKTHMANHPRFICDYCDKVFYLKMAVFIHIKRIHLKVRHRCKKCGNKYDYKYLKRHMKRCKGNIE